MAGAPAGCTPDSVVIPINNAPVAAIVSPADGANVRSGAPVSFDGRVAAEGAYDAVVVTWTSAADGLLNDDPADSDGGTGFATADLSAGEQVITLRVIDEDGNTGEDSVAITVGTP